MRTASAVLSLERSSPYRAIFWGGLIAGILDITFAFVFYGMLGATPIRILQSIASGLLGADAYQGGFATAALGTALHFFIATVACTVYYAASRRLEFMVRHAVLAGMAYGVVVWLVMNLIVIPLSAFPRHGFSVLTVVAGIIAHMFCVGLPIALSVRRHS